MILRLASAVSRCQALASARDTNAWALTQSEDDLGEKLRFKPGQEEENERERGHRAAAL